MVPPSARSPLLLAAAAAIAVANAPVRAPDAPDAPAPVASEAAPPQSDPPTPPSACDDAIASAKSALDSNVRDDDMPRLCSEVQGAAEANRACAARVHELLAGAKSCGRAYGAIASCAAGSSLYDPAWTRQMLGRAAADCRARLVSSLHQAKVVDRDLVVFVSQLADAEQSARIWLALGTLARHAKEGAPDARAAAAHVDAQIARALHGARGYTRFYLLETAGNAACDACVGDVRSSLDDEDPALRRAAVAALRFRSDEASLASLCATLDGEENTVVRGHAAWSLRWSAANEVARTACLERAARYDESENVRLTAAQSLFALADRAPTAAAALARLTGADTPEEIAWLAREEPRGFDPFGDATWSAFQ